LKVLPGDLPEQEPSPGTLEAVKSVLKQEDAARQSPGRKARTPKETKETVSLRVLVVDNDPDSLRSLAVALPEHSAEVRTAASVAEALSVLRTWPADIVVGGIGLQDDDGSALLSKIQRSMNSTYRES
jgi:response regulator RpfG family c-di-GMP phosphodiesterase